MAVDAKSIELREAIEDRAEKALNEQTRISNAKGSYKSLFRYSSSWDTLVLWCSVCCSLAAGAALPLMTVCMAVSNLISALMGMYIGCFWSTSRHIPGIFYRSGQPIKVLQRAT